MNKQQITNPAAAQRYWRAVNRSEAAGVRCSRATTADELRLARRAKGRADAEARQAFAATFAPTLEQPRDRLAGHR